MQFGLWELVIVFVRRLKQSPEGKQNRLVAVGRDLAVVLRSLRTHRDHPEQLPRMPAELNATILAVGNDHSPFVAGQFLAGKMVVQRVFVRQLTGSASV